MLYEGDVQGVREIFRNIVFRKRAIMMLSTLSNCLKGNMFWSFLLIPADIEREGMLT